jgi:4-hydroxybenzoate polyprenyltransferase
MNAVLTSMRPRQWTKNLIVFAPLVFAGLLGSVEAIARSTGAFVAFCLISGALYIANDLMDAPNDRVHETKRKRPIAAGVLSPRVAALSAATALSGAGVISVLLGPRFLLVAAGFAVLQAAYVTWTKHQVILDVMSIATGFVLRAIAGGVAIAVPVSSWLLLCAGLLALFLGFAKRRHELLLLEERAFEHRPVLSDYSTGLIDSILSAVTAATIVAYALYTFYSSTARETHYLMLTVPFVIYGLFRYLYLIHQRNLGGSPEEILLSDRPLIVAILLWLATSAGLLYIA